MPAAQCRSSISLWTVCGQDLLKPGRFYNLDQDVFWLNQPKNINLIAFKVIEQLYGFT